jgi:hypothetical protein
MYQRDDWRQRPLPPAMVRYAREDTRFLLGIYDRLRSELASASPSAVLMRSSNAAGAPAWVRSPSLLAIVLARSTEKALAVYVKDPFDADALARLAARLSVASEADARGRTTPAARVFFALADWRDARARTADESTEYVLPNAFMARLSTLRPQTINALSAASTSLPALVRSEMSHVVDVIKAAVAGAAPPPPSRPAALAPLPQRILPLPPAPVAVGADRSALSDVLPPPVPLLQILKIAEPGGGWLSLSKGAGKCTVTPAAATAAAAVSVAKLPDQATLAIVGKVLRELATLRDVQLRGLWSHVAAEAGAVPAASSASAQTSAPEQGSVPVEVSASAREETMLLPLPPPSIEITVAVSMSPGNKKRENPYV